MARQPQPLCACSGARCASSEQPLGVLQHQLALRRQLNPLATPVDQIAAEALVDGLEQLNVDLQVPRLGQCRGMDENRFRDGVQKMARDALASGSPQNNPRVPSDQEIVDLYRKAW